MLKILLLALFLIILSAPCAAQRIPAAKIDAYVKAEMRKQQIPGISLVILRNGRIALLRSYGLANVEHRVRVKPETVFQSGSIGKQFTAAAIMILVQDGKISLDDRLAKFFPDVPATWSKITVRHLLNHTSGLGDYPPEIELQRNYTEEELFDAFKRTPLQFAPETDWDYSNTGYVILGILIRKVTGKFYGDFLQERIFRPLGMTTARVISEADIISNRAAGYRLVDGQLKNQEWVSPSTNSTADGALYLTILDLAKWDTALYTDWPLKQPTRELIWNQTRLENGRLKPYGFGWHTNVIHHHRLVFHGGAWQGFKSSIVRVLDDRTTIIFLANSWATNDFKLTRGLLAVLYTPFALPPVEPIPDNEPKLSALARRVLLDLSKGTINSDLVTPELRQQLTPERLKQLSDKINGVSLPVAVIHLSELTESREANGLRIHKYLLTDIGESLSATVTFTKENKIARVELSEL